MSKKRKIYSAEFKSRLVLELYSLTAFAGSIAITAFSRNIFSNPE
jgi:hypothetical protein